MWISPAPIEVSPGPDPPEPTLVPMAVVTVVVDMLVMRLFKVHDVLRGLTPLPVQEEFHQVNQSVDAHQDYHLELHHLPEYVQQCYDLNYNNDDCDDDLNEGDKFLYFLLCTTCEQMKTQQHDHVSLY